MGVYQFEIRDRNFVVDIESGNFFEVDKAASDAVLLMGEYPDEEVKKRLSAKYGAESADLTIGNLSQLKGQGMLFSPEQKVTTDIKRRITDITLNIVNTCNLRCRYCWNQAGSYGKVSPADQKMHEQTAFKAIDLLVKESEGAEDLIVDFYGGEPLLNFELIKKVIEHCGSLEKGKKYGFRFLLATNGTLFTKERGEYLIGNGVDVAVSLDGSREIQDSQRPFSDGKGSFDVIMSNIKSLDKKYRKHIVGRATFTPHSREIIETFKFLRGLDFERIEVCESEKAGYGLGSDSPFFFSGAKGMQDLKDLYYNLSAFYTQEILNGNLTYENTYFNRFFKQLSRLYHIQSIIGTCSAGFSLIAVDMDGSLYPCTAFVGIPQFKIGSVESGLDEEKMKVFFDAKISSSQACGKCWAKRICRGCGSCYNLNYFSNNNTGQPDPYYCELFRYKTKLMIAMIAEIARENPDLLEKVLVPEYYVTRGRKRKLEN